MKKITLSIGFIALLAMVSCKHQSSSSAEKMEPKSYPMATLVKEDVELQSTYPAVLKGEVDIDIKPRVEGYIDVMLVDEGSIVKKGQAMFKINSPSSVQSLESAQANYNTAKTDVERMRPLADKGIISNVRLDTYKNTLASTKAALDQAKASIGWTTVTSPIDGIVGTISFRQGSLVNSSSVLTTVSNTKNIVAYFSMNEKDLLEFLRSWEGNTQAEKIKNMPALRLQLADGSIYEQPGKIETIAGAVDATSGSVNFRASFPNSQGLLRSGTSGKVIIPRLLKDVLYIPQKATISQQDKVLVYKVEGDSVVLKSIHVKITPDGQHYAVLDGINAGDKIVTDGIVSIKNGQKIKL